LSAAVGLAEVLITYEDRTPASQTSPHQLVVYSCSDMLLLRIGSTSGETMDEHHDRRFPLWSVITTAAIVGSAMASGTWYIARARLDEEIRQYEKSEKWQLPKLLADLGAVSAELNKQLQNRAELQRLRSQVPALITENSSLKAQIEASKNELSEAKR